MLAEWEDWVRAEEKKCARIEAMVQGKKGEERERAEEVLGKGFEEYCRSCRGELRGIGEGERLL